MRTLASSVGFLLLAAYLSGCGKEATDTIETLLPAENAVPGFVYDPDYPAQPVITTKRELEGAEPSVGTTGGINGSADPFLRHNFSAFLQRYYSNGDYEARIWLVQVPDVAASASLFNDDVIVSEKNHHWEAVSVGDAGRVSHDGGSTTLHARKGLFFFKIYLKPESGSDVPENSKDIVIDFGKVIASNIK